MESIDCFVIDNCFESLLTAVFESYRLKVRPRWLFRRRPQGSLFQFGAEVVKTDSGKACRVWRYLAERVDELLLDMLLSAHAVGSEQTDLAIFRVICKLVDGHVYLPGDYSDSDLADVLWTSRRARKRTCTLPKQSLESMKLSVAAR